MKNKKTFLADLNATSIELVIFKNRWTGAQKETVVIDGYSFCFGQYTENLGKLDPDNFDIGLYMLYETPKYSCIINASRAEINRRNTIRRKLLNNDNASGFKFTEFVEEKCDKHQVNDEFNHDSMTLEQQPIVLEQQKIVATQVHMLRVLSTAYGSANMHFVKAIHVVADAEYEDTGHPLYNVHIYAENEHQNVKQIFCETIVPAKPYTADTLMKLAYEVLLERNNYYFQTKMLSVHNDTFVTEPLVKDSRIVVFDIVERTSGDNKMAFEVFDNDLPF